MRKKIWRMSEDKFDFEKPQLTFEEDTVMLEAAAGTRVQGVFTITSANEVPMRGMVYSSHPYVVCRDPQFEGTHVTIRYEVCGENYQEGDCLGGYFDILCNQVERRCPFEVRFIPQYPVASTGEIRSLEDFAVLAQGHWNEAMQLFYSREFEAFMERLSPKLSLLYRGYRKALPSAVNLEEFLVSAGVKERVVFEVAQSAREFYGVAENQKETIEITKNTWGYLEIAVKSDNPMVTVEKEQITSDYFLGSTLSLNYYVHKNRMHDGKNLARISIDGKDIHREVRVTASFRERGAVRRHPLLDRHKRLAELTKIYEDYRLQRITTGEWCDQSVALLDVLIEECPEDNWYLLMKAHAYIANQQRQEALWIIQKLKRSITDKKNTHWAYLLYLCTLIEREESYVDRLTQEIETIFSEHPEDVRIFWFLLFLRSDYVKNAHDKLRDIEKWVMGGCRSSYLLVEAYHLYQQNPYFLKSFSDFALRVMYWAKHRQALTQELAIQMMHAMEEEKEFRPSVFALLEAAYEVYPKQEFLVAMVSYLLRGPVYHEKYLPWYEKAVLAGIKLTGLYEAYLMSLPAESVAPLPQIVSMYFRYNSNLSYEKRALLYSNVIANKKKQPQIYEQYLRAMELFAIEQMKLGRIDDNLAVLYQEILQKGIIGRENASFVAPLVFVKKVICLYPDIQRVILYRQEFSAPVIAPVTNRCAYLPFFSRVGQIFLEDRRGYLITDPNAYYVEELMYPEQVFEKLFDPAGKCLPYMIWDLGHKERAEDFTVGDLPSVSFFLETAEISKEFKRKMYPVLLAFLQRVAREDLIEPYLQKDLARMEFDRRTLIPLAEFLIERNHMEEAYELLRENNCLETDPALLLRLCHARTADEEAADDYLIALCAYLLEQDLATENTIAYLVKFYVGPTALMAKLWNAAWGMHMPQEDFEERLLMQMLYGENFTENHSEVFASYLRGKGNRMVIEAYLTWFSHRCLTFGDVMPPKVLELLQWYYSRGEKMNESCRIALTKCLAQKPELEETEYELLDALIRDNILRNVYFAFYKKMDRRLIVKYHLYDKYFVEYHGKPGDHITMICQENGKPQVQEELVEMYHGIFVKQFVLFFGDTVEYQLFKNGSFDMPVVTDRVVVSDSCDNQQSSRYDFLNRMESNLVYGEDEALCRDMKMYQGLQQVTETLFGVL